MVPGTYYIGGYLWDGSKPTYSHLKQAITITSSARRGFVLSSPTLGSYTAGTSVSIHWTAGGVVAGSTISLCYDADKFINGNEHWIEIDGRPAADGTATYTWNTTGVAPGTYYVAGYCGTAASRPTLT